MPHDKCKKKEASKKKGKDTINKGVHTEVVTISEPESLHEQLRNVIELMGPSTPNFKSSSEEDSYCCSISEIKEEPKSENKTNIDYDNNGVCNTPRDISEYSSIPTDTVEVYLEPKICMQNIPMNINSNQQFPVQNDYHVPACQCQNQLMEKKNPGAFGKITSFFNMKSMNEKEKDCLDLYRINILQHKNDNCPPKKVIFDLVDEIPKPIQNNVATNTKAKICFCHAKTNTSVRSKANKSCNYVFENSQKKCYSNKSTNMCNSTSDMVFKHNISERSGKMHKETFYEPTIDRCTNTADFGNMARVDVYYFDHGNSAYYHTTDSPPIIITEIIAEKTENYTTKFWAEVFGTVHIGFSFFTSFVLQLFRFLLHSLLRPLTIGILQLGSDYFFKPLLATVFNAIIQPILIFIYNIMTSLRDIMDPLAEGLGYFLRELAVVFRAIRIIDYRKGIKSDCISEIRRSKQNCLAK